MLKYTLCHALCFDTCPEIPFMKRAVHIPQLGSIVTFSCPVAAGREAVSIDSLHNAQD